MITFDRALPQLLGICERTPGFREGAERICVVRDLRGRLRLAVQLMPSPASTFDSEQLDSKLVASLGRYFEHPILLSDGSTEVRRLVAKIFQNAAPWPAEWPSEHVDEVTGDKATIDRARWCAVRRVLSKQAWLERSEQSGPPWRLVAQAQTPPPVIVSFYSYKGGVGRTTLLALVARSLAMQGNQVAVIDLDLEAPGVALFLGASTPEGRGVIDFMVDHVVTGAGSIAGLSGPATALTNIAANVDVFPAGSVSFAYLEKLARLDFATTSADAHAPSPSELAVVALLKEVRRTLKPDFILLDSRAGLHDLGGLSLHSLSHIDVLVSRGGPQALEGLSITAEALARRRSAGERRIVVVHSLVPPDPELGERERTRFRGQAYRIFERTVYDEEDELPAEDDDGAAHFSWPIKRYTELENAGSLADVDAAVADSEQIQAIVDRIKALAVTEET